MQHPQCEMATFANASNTSKLICIIVKSPRKHENHKQQLLFRVDCCCAESRFVEALENNSFSKVQYLRANLLDVD